jgi:alpha-acetolactate decarboxylase
MLKKGNGDLMHEDAQVYHNKSAGVIAQTLVDELTKEFVVIKSHADYVFHENEAVEYYKYKALFSTKERLTVHVFTCYCEPLNENQSPPF